MVLGFRLKAVRKHFGLTQKLFASKLKITKLTIINYEKGSSVPDSKLLYLIHKTFKINLHWLLTGEGEMYSTGTDQDMAEELVKLRSENNKLKKVIENQDSLIKILKNN